MKIVKSQKSLQKYNFVNTKTATTHLVLIYKDNCQGFLLNHFNPK